MIARTAGAHLLLGSARASRPSHSHTRQLGCLARSHTRSLPTTLASLPSSDLRSHSLALLSSPRNRTDVADFKREQVKRVEQGTQTVLRIQQTLRGSVLRQVLDPFFKMCSFFAEEE